MSGWKSPPEIDSAVSYFWSPCTKSLTNDDHFIELFEVQQYVGPLERLYLYAGASDGHYRILTRPPFQRVVATAENKDKILEFIHLAHIEILPRVKGLSMELFHSLLPSLLEKLAHQTTLSLLREWNLMEEHGLVEVDLATVIEGIKNDSLMMSITFEYEYKNPPPPELLCATCMLPAIDPHVSPYFLGKVFCKSCTSFEGCSFFLKAQNLATMLDELEVYCPFSSFGCRECMPREQLGEHLKECPHVRIVCVNKHAGCPFGAKSKIEAIEHMQMCEYAPAMCHDIMDQQKSNTHSSLPLPSHFLPRLRDIVNTATSSNSGVLSDAQSTNPNLKRKCHYCSVEEGSNNINKPNGEKKECSFHSGTWCGYTFKQVQEWRFMVWKQRLNAGVKCIVHFPLEVAKSTTALGVGVISFSAIVAGAFMAASTVFLPEMLIVGGFLLVAPTPVTSIVASTVFSPTLLYNLLYKIPYNLIWRKAPPKLENEQQPEAWTCCNQLGSNAEPCETRGVHSFDN